jgi:hypothetical protein
MGNTYLMLQFIHRLQKMHNEEVMSVCLPTYFKYKITWILQTKIRFTQQL